MDEESATLLVQNFLSRICADEVESLRVFPEHTETHDFGWVFYYGNPESSNPIAGNGPIIVDRINGNLHPTGTAYPPSDYIQNFRETGNPNCRLGRTIALNCLRNDDNRIAIIMAIRDAANLSLGAAKRCLEDCLDGLNPTVDLESCDAAITLTKTLTDLGLHVTRNKESR